LAYPSFGANALSPFPGFAIFGAVSYFGSPYLRTPPPPLRFPFFPPHAPKTFVARFPPLSKPGGPFAPYFPCFPPTQPSAFSPTGSLRSPRHSVFYPGPLLALFGDFTPFQCVALRVGLQLAPSATPPLTFGSSPPEFHYFASFFFPFLRRRWLKHFQALLTICPPAAGFVCLGSSDVNTCPPPSRYWSPLHKRHR